MSLFFRVAGVVAVLLVFFGAGILTGEHVNPQTVIVQMPSPPKPIVPAKFDDSVPVTPLTDR